MSETKIITITNKSGTKLTFKSFDGGEKTHSGYKPLVSMEIPNDGKAHHIREEPSVPWKKAGSVFANTHMELIGETDRVKIAYYFWQDHIGSFDQNDSIHYSTKPKFTPWDIMPGAAGTTGAFLYKTIIIDSDASITVQNF